MPEGASFRLERGGQLNRGRPVEFTFNGRSMSGYEGDTLASALLANGVRLIGRSFKYHRPRGLLAAGMEEPNGLIQLGSGAQSEPNLRATEIELTEGLEARSVNCWPSVRTDFGALNDRLSAFLPAGFYYKTFMWPTWHLYEGVIRRAAGLGRAPDGPDPDRYEARYAHCDVLVVGAGPAGLAAASAAAGAGARVMLVEQDRLLGGRALWDDAAIDDRSAADWISRTNEELSSAKDVRILTRTTAIGYFDHNAILLVEKLPPAGGSGNGVNQRLWQVRAKQVILATGVTERPLVFSGNDVPGVMLAAAVRQYVARYAVLPGRRAALFTNNDDAYKTALSLRAAGAEVPIVVDTRMEPPRHLVEAIEAAGANVVAGGAVVGTKGRLALSSITIADASGQRSEVSVDLLAVSGGFNPNVQLFCQSGGKLVFDERQLLFKPGGSVQNERSVGGAAGTLGLGEALREAHAAGSANVTATAPLATAGAPGIDACWEAARGPQKAFVDFQNDVTTDDIALAVRENYRSVEHLKRYTTLGMAPDQGKTSSVNAIAILAALTGRTIEETGTTKYRFPAVPVSLGAMAGERRGELFKPCRRLPTRDRHLALGAEFEEYGGWERPAYYAPSPRSFDEAVQAEALAVRRRVGLFDGSPLGKIEVKGRDSAKFLDFIYANRVSNLQVGRVRYGLMLNEQGVIIDDGVVTRLADEHFLVGTTGAGAEKIAAWLEEWLQCELPHFEVILAPVTGAWAVLTLSGPEARSVLGAAGTDLALSPEEFPHMRFQEGAVAGLPARVLRVSFTGEVSYEINVPWNRATELFDALLRAGEPFGISPVGVEAWMLLRTEKGYLHVGGDTDGTTIPQDVGWGRVLKKDADFVGRRSLTRPDSLREDRHQFVGLRSIDGSVLPIGAHLVDRGSKASEGYVTASGFSPVLGRGVALAMIRAGQSRIGKTLYLSNGARTLSAEIVEPAAFDPRGERLNG